MRSMSNDTLLALTTRGKVAVIAFTDIDGTANNEELPESQRLSSIEPAREVIDELQGRGIPTGVITGRSFGEALVYSNALKCRGPIICEDGAIVVLPQDLSLQGCAVPQDISNRIVSHCGRWVVSLSSAHPDNLTQAVDRANELLQQRAPGHTRMIASSQLADLCTELNPIVQARAVEASEDFRVVKRWIGYDTDAALLAAAHRLATCFVAMENYEAFDQTGPKDVQRECVFTAADEFGLDAFSPRLPHLRAKGVDKAGALSVLNRHATLFLGVPCAGGILPLCFGNNDNDVSMMQDIEQYGGVGVVVAHSNPEKGHYIDVSQTSRESLYVAQQPYGLGMQEGLPFIYERLRRLGVKV